jgi:FkbM family methyltransferase
MDATTYGFMFDLVCNENRYTPLIGHKVLDLGAHFGFFSLYCASRGAHVTAYEPDPDNFDRLLDAEGRAEEIGLGYIEAHNKAIWYEPTALSLFRDHHSGTSNVVSLGTFRNKTVEAISLHTALADREWDCVKMDIEGAEFDVLARASIEDLKKIKYLSLELHNHIGSNPQPRYEALIEKLSQVFSLSLVEKREKRFCKAFCTRK